MTTFCCDDMEEQVLFVCEEHDDPFECPDQLISYSEIFDEFGIIIHDGTQSAYLVSFCPWCGKKLPESKRAEWFATLKLLGFDDPWEEEIPEEFKTDAWYRDGEGDSTPVNEES